MIVVTGATGNVGGPLVQALAAVGEQVTAVSRSATEASANVRHQPADLTRPDTLRPAFDGADALFLLLPPGSEQTDPQAVLDAAKACGITRVVLLSSQGAATRPNSPAHAHLRGFEAALHNSSLDWTILRPGGFYTNSFAWAESVRSQRLIAAPFADIALPHLDPADIAGVAAVALREPGHSRQIYQLTGPAAITPRQQATAIEAALGSPIQFVEPTRAEAREQLLRFMPEAIADGTLDILGAPLPAEQLVSSDVERIVGRAPTGFGAWAANSVEVFR